MTKFSNVLKAAGVMMGLVWGVYGNKDVSATAPVTTSPTTDLQSGKRSVTPSAAREAFQRVGLSSSLSRHPVVGQQTDYPTVMKRVAIDLTDKPSRTRSISAPFKSDRGGDGNLP